MSKAPIFYVMGVSGCGKSTIGKLLAQEFGLPFFDGDDYHPEANVLKMAKGTPLNDTDRQEWLERLNSLAIENKDNGLVVACSALKNRYRKILMQNLTEQIDFVYLAGTFEEVLERVRLRKNHFMPAKLLKSQFDALEPPKNCITVSINSTPLEIVSEVARRYKNKKPRS